MPEQLSLNSVEQKALEALNPALVAISQDAYDAAPEAVSGIIIPQLEQLGVGAEWQIQTPYGEFGLPGSLFSTQASYVGRLHNFAHVDLSGVEVNALSLIEEVHFVLVKPEIQGRLGRVIQHAEVRLVPNIEEIAPKSVIIDDDTQLQMINPASL